MYTMIPFTHMSRSFNDLFDEMERSMFPTQQQGRLPAFRTDIRDAGDHYLLEADLPGFQKGDIDLHLEDGVLTITAAYENGVLTLILPKQGEVVPQSRKIAIQ